LGGIALNKLGASWCFGLNGLSFVAVIISLLMIRVNFVPEKTQQSVIESMQQGIEFIRRREGMTSLVILAFLLTLLSYPLITFLPVMAREVLHGGSNIFTLLLCLSGLGSVIGALLVAGIQDRIGQAKHALLIMLLLGALMAGFGISRNLVLSSALVFGAGASLMIVFASNSSLVQLNVRDTMRGRVMSVYNVAFRGGMPFGSLISGFLIKQTSAPAMMLLNGLLVIVLALYFLVIQRRLSKL
jgi:predicted MFS family arabinose efflux permease